MANLIIDDALARQLRELAQRENRSVDEVMASLLAQYTPNQGNSLSKDPLLTLADAARKFDLRSSRSDISSRSREILNSEWPEHLKYRQDPDAE
jgi:hypothetical protein